MFRLHPWSMNLRILLNGKKEDLSHLIGILFTNTIRRNWHSARRIRRSLCNYWYLGRNKGWDRSVTCSGCDSCELRWCRDRVTHNINWVWSSWVAEKGAASSSGADIAKQHSAVLMQPQRLWWSAYQVELYCKGTSNIARVTQNLNAKKS